MNELNIYIEKIYSYLEQEKIEPQNGIPEELFMFISTISPIPNVDILLTDRNRILFTWRDDTIYGKGWHIPGGCIRMHESIEERLLKTALTELGTDKIVICDSPICVKDAIIEEKRDLLIRDRVRGHNVALLQRCELQAGVEIENVSNDEHTAGYRKWFSRLPDDMLPATMSVYGELLQQWNQGTLIF